MTELQRLVQRHKAGRCLREEVRDRFYEEADGMRVRRDEILRDTGIPVRSETPEGVIVLALDERLNEATTHARLTAFPEGLCAMRAAASCLETLVDIWEARRAMDGAMRQLMELDGQLSGVGFSSVRDYYVLLLCARDYYEKTKYRRARVVAAAAGGGLRRLMEPTPAEEPGAESLAAEIERQRAMLPEIEFWSAADAERTRIALSAIDRTWGKRYFELARTLVRDLEVENAPITTFLIETVRACRTVSDTTVREWLGNKNPGMDWRGAAARLIQQSLSAAKNSLGPAVMAAGKSA